jgi:putative membrane protein
VIIVTNIFIGLTALLHVLFFKLESIDFMKPAVLRKFGLDATSGSYVKVWALNQGFYNLFLAIGLFYSLYLLNTGSVESGKAIASFILLTIASAGVVLFLSSPDKLAAAIVQSAPALIGFALLLISFKKA